MQETRISTLWAGVAALIALVALAAAMFATQPAYAATDADGSGSGVLMATSKTPDVYMTSASTTVRIGQTRNVRVNNNVSGQTGEWSWAVADGEDCITLLSGNKMSCQVIGKKNGVATLQATFTTVKGKYNTLTIEITVTGIKDKVTVDGLTYQRTGLKTVQLVSDTKDLKKGSLRIANQVKVSDVNESQYKCVYAVTKICSKALMKQKSATTKITIGANVKAIGSYAFAGDAKLKNLVVNSTVLTSTKNCLLGGNGVKTVKVPSSKLADYKKLFSKSTCGKSVTVTA